MTIKANVPAEPDCLIGVRECGCITAWMALEKVTKRELREFYASMADTNREVRKANTDEVRDRMFRCEHGGVGEFASER